ncbi:MAG: GAF domain-containing protein [Anaerolineae bacterium]|nr:GAF domain-containing protein [Anaerolineae bacterium]
MESWFKLPVYSDEDQDRTARALKGILLVLLIVLLVSAPLLIIQQRLLALIGSFYGLGGILITWLLLKFRRLRLASLFFTTAGILLLTYFMLVGQGVHDVTIIALPMVLVMAGLMLSRRAYFVLAGLAFSAVMLVILSEIYGWLGFENQHQATYSELLIVSAILIATVVIIRLLADYMFSSLQTTRQFSQRQAGLIIESRAQAEQLRILNQVSNTIASGLDLDRILEELYLQFKQVLPLDSFYVALIDQKQELVTFPLFYSTGIRIEVPAENLEGSSGLAGEVIRTQKTLYIPDVNASGVQRKHKLRTVGPGETRSYVGLPLRLHGEIFGVLSVQSQQPHAYISDQLRLLETITAQASVAIDSARLYTALEQQLGERQRMEEALQQRDRVHEAVAFAAETFLKASDWRNVIDGVLQRLCAEIDATHAYIYDAERGEAGRLLFALRYEHLTDGSVGSPINPQIGVQTSAEKMGSKRWLYSMLRGAPYLSAVSTQPQDEGEFANRRGALSFLDLPVTVGSEFWGVIGFENALHERLWSETEVDSLKVAASVLGAAIQRQRADEAVRKLNLELERRVTERTIELQLANQELESFAYSVSHDLRAPLRGIDGYSGLLVEDYHAALDEQGKAYLNNIRQAASQMSDLIDDLLKLSRVTRVEMHRQVVDLTAIAEQIAADCRRREPRRAVEISIQPELQVYGDPHLLKLALENLVNNAWKFTRRAAEPRIEIGATHQKGNPIYFVRDNGVGFDMKYHDKLFRAFQRLHDSSDFEGTGIGLATVQRVIQRHSGQVWAESEPDQGAAFYFTLFDPKFVIPSGVTAPLKSK